MKTKSTKTIVTRGRKPGPDSLPHKIQCVITGQFMAVRPDVLKVRIEKAGSLEKLQKIYLSNDAKRMLREGLSVKQIRESVKQSSPKDPVPTTPVDQKIIDGYLNNISTPQRHTNGEKNNSGEVVGHFIESATTKIIDALRPVANKLARELVH